MDTMARNSYSGSYSNSRKDTKRKPWSNLSIGTLVLLAAVTGGHVGYEMGSRAPKPGHVVLKNHQHICEEEERPRDQQQQQHSATDNRRTCIEFPESIGKLAVGMSLVPRRDFADKFDAGVPLQPTAAGNEHVLILHGHPDAMPPATDRPTTTPSVEDATANCDYLTVVLTDVDSNRKQCVAIMGQYEAPHLQKWMRLPVTGPDVVSTEPLHFVGRLMKELGGGSDSETTPFPSETRDHWDFLRNYTQSLDSILNELRPLAGKVATKNTVVVMFSNYGQSELIVNFICSAHNRNIDLSSVLFFATDPETKALVEGLGMHVFYSRDIFGNLPSGAAQVFGDKTFADMMRAKIMCLHLTNLLGYDVLFQDADVIWYRDPLPYFQKELLQRFDVLTADDGNNLASYLPYRANGGFFYVRNNRKTLYLMNSMLLLLDSAIGGDEQHLLNQVLAEYSSLYGIKVKSLGRELFPTGVVYHQETEIMRGIFDGRIKPYMFHMSWTTSKTDKLLYFQQMGEWYVDEQCFGNRSATSDGRLSEPDSSMSLACCSAEPLITCHFVDKPSHVFCNQSRHLEEIVGDEVPSFW